MLNQFHIGFHIGHLQAQSGFSWRVIDFMASGACPVVYWASDLDLLFPEKILPTYKSENEARELCKKILENPNMSKEIVMYCNEQIEKNYRPNKALKQIEAFVNVKLLSVDDIQGEGLYRNITPIITNKHSNKCKIYIKKIFGKSKLYILARKIWTRLKK